MATKAELAARIAAHNKEGKDIATALKEANVSRKDLNQITTAQRRADEATAKLKALAGADTDEPAA